MASSHVPVVDILDDDDDDHLAAAAAFSSPPSSRKRSRGSTSPADFLDTFSPSPPLHKRLLLAAGDPILLDDTPSPPKRRPSSSAPKLPVLVVDDDDGPSAPDDVVTETPDSVLYRAAFSETPETAVPSSVDLDIAVAETPGFTSPRLVGPPASRGLSSAAPAQKLSEVSSLISLDSDGESDDDTMHREPSINLASNIPNSDPVSGPGSTVCTGKVDSGRGTAICTRMPKVKKWQNEDDAQHIEVKEKKQQEEKRLTKEDKAKLMEERKQKRQEDKLHKKAMKDQLAKKKKKDKEIKEWESGKFALKCITAEIHSSVIESGLIGGCLLSSLAEQGLSYKVTKDSIKGSILWSMKIPNDIAHALFNQNDDCNMNQASVSKVPYISIVLQAEEFCDLISNGSFFSHVEEIRNRYPKFTICYITYKLMNYINKCEQSQYKNNSTTWKRPPVEEVLCKLATHYTNVHSRQCIDEAEVAEHLVGLTSNLAKCKFRKPLTWLSVHANGAIIPKGFVDKNLAKKDTWLKALIAIPDIQPRYAMAIWKKYPCMRSLLNEYMDPSKTVREKELLLSDLKWEDRLGDEGKRLGNKCSIRVYRMLMAQNGDLDTDGLEAGGSA
ncbi:Crossover junction endonuclease EME1 [Dichanthelium oligosanthes]|uniref:Crossover junction endonuclease EME1 n=1 Tax=Dichanthelium oligosanthes TaxID=888268 RepID=A0A1E5VX68_9POAL|nr:Crossover junction endonuclease EME1 [Dichanthelium oligosanthes]